MDVCSYNYIWYIFLGLAFFLGISYYTTRMHPDYYMLFNMYLQIGTMTIFVINLLVTLDNYKTQTEDRNKSYYSRYASIAQMKVNDVDKMLFSSPILNRLYVSMYADDPHIEQYVKLIGELTVTPETILAEHHACSIIFQTMANIYMTMLLDRSSQFHREDLSEWNHAFSRWMKSPILRSHWVTLKIEQHPKFIEYIDQMLKVPPSNLI